MNAKNLLKRAACLFSLTGLALSVSAQSRFADAMRQAYAKPERIYQFYVQHQPDSIYKQGEDVFSPYLSSDQFAAQLRAMEERLGDPVEASMWEIQQMAGCEIYSRKITFPRHSATLNVVFDPSGSLLGFTFTDEKALLTETESAHHIYVSDTIQLPARLTMPSASSVKDRVPVVILVHGSGPSNMDESMGPNAPFRDLAEGLSRRGVAVLRYDKRTFVCPQFFANATAGFTYDDETVDDAISGKTPWLKLWRSILPASISSVIVWAACWLRVSQSGVVLWQVSSCLPLPQENCDRRWNASLLILVVR